MKQFLPRTHDCLVAVGALGVFQPLVVLLGQEDLWALLHPIGIGFSVIVLEHFCLIDVVEDGLDLGWVIGCLLYQLMAAQMGRNLPQEFFLTLPQIMDLLIASVILIIILFMVILNKSSTIDRDRYPLCHNWDVLCRQNYAIYQHEIDKHSYAIQRSRRSIFSFLFPKFMQLEMLKLDTLKKKQQLGQIYQHEIQTYKSIDSRINWNYNRCFQGSGLTSYVSIGIGGILALSLNKRCGFVIRAISFFIPILAEQVMIRPNAVTYAKVKEFLDFTIATRKAKCLIELFGEDYATDLNGLYLKNGNVYKLMESMIKLNEVKAV